MRLQLIPGGAIMEIHNLMEDLVLETVNEFFDSKEKGSAGSWCTCGQCRQDVACFVLNRLKPEYVVSGRGVAYVEQDYGEKLQKIADVVSMVREGWSKVNASKRPNHPHTPSVDEQAEISGPVFNIPPIMGRLFNGSNFEPISNITIELYDGENLVPMLDSNWQNPCSIVEHTAGTFIFWPHPVQCTSLDESKVFSYEIRAEIPGFEDLKHFVELEVVSSPTACMQFSMHAVHHLADLIVFPK
jgi:competence protein ComFB